MLIRKTMLDLSFLSVISLIIFSFFVPYDSKLCTVADNTKYLSALQNISDSLYTKQIKD